MKRSITFLIGILIVCTLSAQTGNSLTYPLTLGKVGVSNGQLILKGSTSGTSTIRVPVAAGTGTIFQVPGDNGTLGYVLRTDGNGILTWVSQLRVNVKDYGATGDGTTDDRTAIVNAIAAIPVTGGTVFFPVGRYKVSSQILVDKPVSYEGVPVMRYTTSGGFEYEAGSVIVSGGSGITLLKIRPTVLGAINWRGSSISNLHFIDLAGKNDTLVKIVEVQNTRIHDCSFQDGAIGLYVDCSGTDASWTHVIDNYFVRNNVGIYLDNGTTALGLPCTYIKGGMFSVLSNQKGIYANRAVNSIMSGFKMDLSGTVNVRGIDWTGSKSSISDVKFESNATDTTSICILSHGSLNMSGIGIQFNTDYGVGIMIHHGNSANDPNIANTVTNSQITRGQIGVWLDTLSQGNIISNVTANSQTIANVKIEPTAYYNYINGLVSNSDIDATGGLVDNGVSTIVANYIYSAGGLRSYYNPNTILTGIPVAPTAAAGTNTTQLATTAFVKALGDLKVDIADTAAALSPYARKASPTFTGTVTIPTPFTLGATSVTATGTELNYSSGVTHNIQTQFTEMDAAKASPINTALTGKTTVDSIRVGADGATITAIKSDGFNYEVKSGDRVLYPSFPANMLSNDDAIYSSKSDTVPQFAVGAGIGLSGSQSSLLPGAYLGMLSNNSPSDTMYITSGRFFVVQDSGTVTMGFKFFKHATDIPTSASTDMMSGEVVLSAATNATTTGTIITHTSTPHFDVIMLLPGETMAGIVTTKSNGNIPKLMTGTVAGYWQNRKY